MPRNGVPAATLDTIASASGDFKVGRRFDPREMGFGVGEWEVGRGCTALVDAIGAGEFWKCELEEKRRIKELDARRAYARCRQR